MIHHDTPTEHLKGLLGLLLIWGSWLFGHLTEIKEGVQIVASCTATIASLIYGWYYLMKIKQEKK